MIGNLYDIIESDYEGNMILNNTIENRISPTNNNMITGYESIIIIGNFLAITMMLIYASIKKKYIKK